MGGRVVEGTGLENRQGRKSLVGSNPTPSAIELNLGRRLGGSTLTFTGVGSFDYCRLRLAIALPPLPKKAELSP